MAEPTAAQGASRPADVTRENATLSRQSENDCADRGRQRVYAVSADPDG
jgi:hypothetical protein